MQTIPNESGTFNIGKKCFHYKKCDPGVELVAGKVQDMFGVKHIQYSPIQLYETDYCICDESDYLSVESPNFFDCNNFNCACDYLSVSYPDDSSKLIEQFTKMYFIDLLLLNVGRQAKTWGIVRKSGEKDI